MVRDFRHRKFFEIEELLHLQPNTLSNQNLILESQDQRLLNPRVEYMASVLVENILKKSICPTQYTRQRATLEYRVLDLTMTNSKAFRPTITENQ